VSGNSFGITLPALSTTAVILKGTAVGIEDNHQDLYNLKSLRAYPNPTSGKLKIQFAEEITGNITLKFADLAGNTVLTRDAENNSEIDLSETGLASGLYVLTAEYQGQTWRTKLVYTGSK